MIVGAVNAELQPRVSIVVQGPQGEVQTLEAIVDTGFNGFLSLPEATIKPSNLSEKSAVMALLAAGNETLLQNYEGTVIWDGTPMRGLVDKANWLPSSVWRCVKATEWA